LETSLNANISVATRSSNLKQINEIKINNSDDYVRNLIWIIQGNTSNPNKTQAAIQLKNFIKEDWNQENSLISDQLKRTVVDQVLIMFENITDKRLGKLIMLIIE